MQFLSIAFAYSLLITANANAQPVWPDTFLSRLETLALIQTLNAEILASKSATQSLEKWCRDHKLAAEPKILAHLIPNTYKAPTAEQVQHLQVADQEQIKYRRVQLSCGDQVLSEAENWYVPSRLTPEMNQLLETTDIPFGKVVLPLQPYRQTFNAKLLWTPLPEGWENTAYTLQDKRKQQLAIPEALFEHHAMLYTAEHQPFAEVSEIYQKALLAFTTPAPH